MSGDDLRAWVQALPARLAVYFTPPSVLTERPPSVFQLRDYARYGTWTYSGGLVRRLGIGWFAMVAMPVTIASRYVEWISQRFTRTLAVFVIWRLVLATPAGPWLIEYALHPVQGFLSWLFL
ncbi:hypothetical protein [Catellatospora sp. NPDC049133]|uniref:hypothetical protein n=1 Tax=Catellatospora sp. NPDC049133 TaxID=3155499 RepID=UPI0033F5115E